MRISMSLVLTVGLGCGFAQPAWAQTKQTAWQRLTGIFKSKNQNDEAKKEPSIGGRVSAPTTPQEGRGVVFVDEPKSAAPAPAGWALKPRAPVAKTPAAAPILQRASTQPAANSPASQPGPPIIVESSTPVSQPTSYPKAVGPLPASNQPEPVVVQPTQGKTAKASAPGRDVSRLTRQIAQACPKAKNVKLMFTSPTELTIEMEVISAEECSRHAEQVFAIRDLDPYRVNLKFKVPQN